MGIFKDIAKNKKLNLTPLEMGFTSKDFCGICTEQRLNEFYLPLLVNSPTGQSQWFVNIDNSNISNEDEIVTNLLTRLKIPFENFIVFRQYESEKHSITDIKLQVQSCKGRKLICKVDEKNVVSGIYRGIRNSIAHGCFGVKNGLFIFFSVRLDNKIANHFEKSLSFYLELENINQLNDFVDIMCYL